MRFSALLLIAMSAFPGWAALTVQATWPELPSDDSVFRASAPALSIQLENRDRALLTLVLEPRIRRDAQSLSLARINVSLRPSETRRVTLNLPRDLNPASFQYSAKLSVHVSAAGDSLTMAPVYFHADPAWLFYREQALRDQFAHGNFRRLPLSPNYALVEAERALTQANIPRMRPGIARVGAALGFAGPNSGGGNGIRFCLAMPGDAYVDSSRGEDFGTFSLTVPMARNWVAVNQAGAPLFSGFLDAQGCTPSLFAAPNAPTTLVWSPIYHHTGLNIRGFLSDLNLGDSWPTTMPLFFLNFNSGNTATTVVLADDNEYAQTIFAAATQGLERYPGGHTDALFEWQIRAQGDNSGSATDYAPEGHPRVNIKYSLAALQKFTVTHEYGHAVLIAKLNPAFSPNDLDYSVTGAEDEQHTVTSKEWQLAAAVEGFAHFVSGVAWNDASPGAGGIFYSDATYDLGVFGKYFESNWNPATYPGQGVELDWAQFFWNYYTDPPALGGVFAPTQSMLRTIWLAAHPWPKNDGFYAAFSGAAAAVLPPLPVGLHHQWFLMQAAQAGINH